MTFAAMAGESEHKSKQTRYANTESTVSINPVTQYGARTTTSENV